MDIIKVVCGIIFDQGKIFICRRRKGKSLEGFWEFPGGKIEKGENYEDTLKRELNEELKMEVENIKYFGTSMYNYNNFSIELIGYQCILKKWDNHLTDHDKFEWVQPKNILDFKLAPADIPLARKLN